MREGISQKTVLIINGYRGSRIIIFGWGSKVTYAVNLKSHSWWRSSSNPPRVYRAHGLRHRPNYS